MDIDLYTQKVEQRGKLIDDVFKKGPYKRRVSSNRLDGVELGEVVIDAGSWIGDSTLAFLRCVGPHGRVIAIECDPISLNHLKSSIEGFDNVTLIERALWSKRRRMKLIIDTDWTCSHSLCEKFNSVRNKNNTVTVLADTLDNIIKSLNLDKLDRIKLNIEGSELEALKGMNWSLDKYEPIVYIMCHYLDGELTTDKCIEFFRDKGWKPEKINDLTMKASKG